MTQRQANLLLATVSLAWGTSYLFMKLCVDIIPPSTIIALRFGIAFLVMIVIFHKTIYQLDARILKYSAIVGALLYVIFIALLYGMKHTTASSAGFLTSTTVIMVPILQAILTKIIPKRKTMIGVGVVSIGLAFLTIGKDFSISWGSLFCLVAAFLYAIHIIVTNQFAQKVKPLLLGIYQLGFAFLYAAVGAFLFETPVLPVEGIHWFAILGLALICSAYGFVIQPIAQKYTTPENTGFLFSLEPIFSALFAFIFLHENMGLHGYFGALLILAGVFIANSISRKPTMLELEGETARLT
jgi:drug/metabolite transporter (DMT)-like permease